MAGNSITDNFNYTVSDGALTDIAVLAITISGADDTPSAISPTAGNVSIFDGSNAAAAVLGAADADDAVWKFSIQSITSNSAAQANDGSLFNLATDANTFTAANILQATTPSGLTPGIYIITVRATDSAGLSKDQDISVTVSNALIVTSAANNHTVVNGGDDLSLGAGYAADVVDGGGLSLWEALHYVAANGTVGFNLASGATLDMNNQTMSVAGGVTFDADAMTTLSINNGTLSLDGTLNVVNGSGDTLTLAANLADNGAVTSALNKSGAGALTLSGVNNTAAGGTGLDAVTVSAGTLAAAGDASLGTGTVTLDGGAFSNANLAFTADNAFILGAGGGIFNVNSADKTLTLTGTVTGSGKLTKINGGALALAGGNSYSGGTQINNGSLRGNTLSLQGDILANAPTAAVVFNQNISGTYAGAISGSGNVTKSGNGQLTLSGANAYTGATLISAGTVSLITGAGLSDVTAVTVSSGAALRLQGASETIGSLAGAGTVTLNGGTLTVGGDHTSTVFSGVLAGTGGLTKIGSGGLELSGMNTYTGATTVSDGQLTLDNFGNSVLADSGAVTVNPGAILLSLADETVGSIAGAGTITLNSGTLTVGGDNTSTTFAGTIDENAGGALIKIGAGTLILSGVNTYSGDTTVTAGALIVTGTAAGAAGVAAGAVLGGTGTLGGAVTVASGGTLAPGVAGGNQGVGKLTLANGLTLAGGSILAVDLYGASAGTGYDQVDVAGAVSLAGAVLARTQGYPPANGDAYILIDNDAGDNVTGAFIGLAEGDSFASSGRSFSMSYVGGSGNDVVLTAFNNAPALDVSQTPTMAGINEDAADADNPGTRIADLVVDNSITDADGAAVKAIAVTAVDNSRGTWQYSTDNGAHWNDFGAVSEAAARLLDGTLTGADTHKIRFVPGADFNGSASVVFRAWDKSGGNAGATADAGANGGLTPFSSAADIATITIAAVNDAPTGGVTIIGDPIQDRTLTVGNTLVDPDGLGDIVYIWKDGDGAVLATGPSLTLTQDDVGKTITVTASYTDGQGMPETITSEPTAAVAAGTLTNATQTVEFNVSPGAGRNVDTGAAGGQIALLAPVAAGLSEAGGPVVSGPAARLETGLGTFDNLAFSSTFGDMSLSSSSAQTSFFPIEAELAAGENAIFTLPATALANLDIGSGVSFQASQADGGRLPPWVRFDAATGSLKIVEGAARQNTVIKIIATDGRGNQTVITVAVKTHRHPGHRPSGDQGGNPDGAGLQDLNQAPDAAQAHARPEGVRPEDVSLAGRLRQYGTQRIRQDAEHLLDHLARLYPERRDIA